ncbi:hypothetical protein [Nonomuraea africana]|uniref:DUF3618 domain-containing protein n=1 Tax=Nonomuraea africana TaxID=46171 RepID=A0ABR9KIR5_9ACTN|nr:hypothetical protein [Nonomuraea africana]MBE1561921.1 hypothetical protein [Nonomuraea africana]
MGEYPAETGTPPPYGQEPQGTTQQAQAAAGQVAETAKEQTKAVAGEARDQTRRVAEQLRERAREQAQHQSERAAQGIRQWADDLAAMNDTAKPDSPVTAVVRQVADGGRRAADYLDQNGLAGLVEEVQNFARRRPAAFLAGALAAGFLVGRIAKAASGTDSTTTPTTPTTPTEPVDAAQPVRPQQQVQPQATPPQQVPAPPATPPPPTWGGEVP